jgi:hypothetical protein
MNHLFIMRLISFDVGIKNLAYCVFSLDVNQKKWSISEWNCANLLAFDSSPPVIRQCCHFIKGKRKAEKEYPCNKNAKWITPDDAKNAYCELHAKMHTEWIIPKKQNTASHIHKLKLPELDAEYAKIYPLDHSNHKMKKAELIERIDKYYTSKCLRSVNENVAKTKTAGETDLVTIGRAIRRQLDEDPAIAGVTHVIIENQISTIASRMKTIQGMIAQYFIMRFGDSVIIEFVSSHNKLKGFSDGKSETTDQPDEKKKATYKANKSDGVAICRKFFDVNAEMREHCDMFEKSKKRDDLADCFLQGIWYLKSNQIISYADNLKINIVFVS